MYTTNLAIPSHQFFSLFSFSIYRWVNMNFRFCTFKERQMENYIMILSNVSVRVMKFNKLKIRFLICLYSCRKPSTLNTVRANHNVVCDLSKLSEAVWHIKHSLRIGCFLLIGWKYCCFLLIGWKYCCLLHIGWKHCCLLLIGWTKQLFKQREDIF